MSWEALLPLLTAIIGGLIGGSSAFYFALKRDQVERKRERIVAHLIEAYRNLEDAAGRNPLSKEQKQNVESSIGATFLFGSRAAAQAAKTLAIETADDSGNMLELLQVLRRDLRKELGLQSHEVELKFLRFRD